MRRSNSRLALVPMCMGRLPSNENRKRAPLRCGSEAITSCAHQRQRCQMLARVRLAGFHAARWDDGGVVVFDLGPWHLDSFFEPQAGQQQEPIGGPKGVAHALRHPPEGEYLDIAETA